MYSTFKEAYMVYQTQLKEVLENPSFIAAVLRKDYQEAYNEAAAGSCARNSLTALFLEGGIDPLPRMKNIVESMYYRLPITHVDIPNNVKSIDNHAFASCQYLESISIPSSVTVIRKSAFQDCTTLESIFIPKSICLIEEWVFSGCKSLRSISYGGTKEEWGEIVKADDWEGWGSSSAPIKTIQCIDGDIKLL